MFQDQFVLSNTYLMKPLLQPIIDIGSNIEKYFIFIFLCSKRKIILLIYFQKYF